MKTGKLLVTTSLGREGSPRLAHRLTFSLWNAEGTSRTILNFGSGNQNFQSHEGKQSDSYSIQSKEGEHCYLQKYLGMREVPGWFTDLTFFSQDAEGLSHTIRNSGSVNQNHQNNKCKQLDSVSVQSKEQENCCLQNPLGRGGCQGASQTQNFSHEIQRAHPPPFSILALTTKLT